MSFAWSDPRFRRIAWQTTILVLIACALWYLVGNTMRNLALRQISTGFDFLRRPAGIPIGETLVDYDPSIDSYGEALWIGVLNTLRVAAVGIVLSTVLGTLIGLARLSRNFLLAKFAALYVEVMRDIPVLLQLLFWYGLLQHLPGIHDAHNPLPGIFVSNRGIRIPWLQWEAAHTWTLLAFVVGVSLSLFWNGRARRIQALTGSRPRSWPVLLVLLVVIPTGLFFILGAPFSFDMPHKEGFNFSGGAAISPEYGALTLGLSLYTAASIAEIVRAGIQAVPNGQREAAAALGLHPFVVLRKITLPLAARVVVPPMTSQYLNLVKNSSLAVAVGYQDMVSINQTTLNQTGQAIECIALIMAIFLLLSLSISLFMNWFNARFALVGR